MTGATCGAGNNHIDIFILVFIIPIIRCMPVLSDTKIQN